MVSNSNQSREIIKYFNKIIESIEVRTPDKSFQTWMVLDFENSLLLWGNDKISQFEELVKLSLNYDNEISSSLSKKFVQGKIIDLLCKYYLTGKAINQDGLEIFIKDLKAIPNEEWEVFRVLNGANLSSQVPLELGPFKIYSWALHQAILVNQYLEDEHWWQVHMPKDSDEVLVSFKAVAREQHKARQIADLKFHQFENVIRYIFGKNNQADIGIFNYYSFDVAKSIAVTSTRKSIESRLRNFYTIKDIDDPLFVNSEFGYDWIWNVLQQSNLSELQRRIISAIEWIGKGVYDNDSARSFVQFTFALEALLTFNPKGTLVSPSIASQLAEFSAFLLGEDCADRIRFEKKIKNLYSIRSAIAHGGSQSVSEELVQEAFNLVKNLIVRITTDSELNSMSSMDQLKNWVNQKKYS